MNINQVIEEMHGQNQHIGITLGQMDAHLAQLVTMENAFLRADVRGGVDVSYAVGVGATSPNNQTVGQVILQVKREDGMLYGIVSFNADSAARYARFYAAGDVPIVGTARPKFLVGMPTGSGAIFFGGIGIPFQDGIWVAATAGMTDTSGDIASPAANTVLVVAFYK